MKYTCHRGVICVSKCWWCQNCKRACTFSMVGPSLFWTIDSDKNRVAYPSLGYGSWKIGVMDRRASMHLPPPRPATTHSFVRGGCYPWARLMQRLRWQAGKNRKRSLTQTLSPPLLQRQVFWPTGIQGQGTQETILNPATVFGTSMERPKGWHNLYSM